MLEVDRSLTNASPAEQLLSAEKEIQEHNLEKARKILAGLDESTDVLNDLAVLAILEQKWEEAIDLLSRVLEVDENNETAKANLSYLNNSLGARSDSPRRERDTADPDRNVDRRIDRKLRIGFVTIWFERGQAYVTKTLHSALSQDHDTFVFARTGIVHDHQMIETKGPWAVPNLTTYPSYAIDHNTLVRWIIDNKIDVVILNEEYDWDLVRAVKSTGVKTVTYLDFYKDEWKPFMALYDAVLCSTLRTYSLVKDICNAYFIGWAVDSDVYRPRGLDDEKYTFFHNAGWLGINFRKMTPAVILAFDAISRELPDVSLLIHAQVGLEKLPREAAEIVQTNRRITYHFETIPAPGLYHKGRILVFPSKLEGLGLPLLEATACGLPVIATDAPPMNEFVRDGVNGMLVRVAKRVARQDNVAFPETIVDVNDLAEKMAVLAADPERVRRMAQASREIAENVLRPDRLRSNLRSALSVLFPGNASEEEVRSPDVVAGSAQIPVETGTRFEEESRSLRGTYYADGNPDFNAIEYWKKRHSDLNGAIQAVGQIDRNEADNLEMYLSRQRKLEELIGILGIDLRGKTVLDAGCGIGIMSKWFIDKGAHLTGIDVSEVAVRHARARCPQGSFLVSDISMLKVTPKFELVACIDVLYHIVDDDKWQHALKAMVERLEIGGYLILVDELSDVRRDTSPHVRFRPREEYGKVMETLNMTKVVEMPFDFSTAGYAVFRHKLMEV